MSTAFLTSGSPIARCRSPRAPLPVVGTHGCRIVLADGRELIDGIASWWSVCHGYNHPHIVESVARQLATMPHVMFGGLVHEQALVLARRLTAMAPRGLSRVFFSDSGSTAVEVALKIALQYWRNVGRSGKDRFLCFTNGYHGDTLGAMSVSDPEKSMHKALHSALVPQYVVDIPSDESSIAELEELLAGVEHQVAAMIVEPLVQCAGGMRFHGPKVMAALHGLAKKHDILLIADEIATGFWRTGHRFACEEAGVSPDIFCLGKALTGGTIGLGATLAREEIFEAFLSDDWNSALMHGPTFMANPLACAAANASLDLFEREPTAGRVQAIEASLRSGLERCRSLTARCGRTCQRRDWRGAARCRRRRLCPAAPVRGTGSLGAPVQGRRVPHASARHQQRRAQRADKCRVHRGQCGAMRTRVRLPRRSIDRLIFGSDRRFYGNPRAAFRQSSARDMQRRRKAADRCKDVLLIDRVEVTTLHR